MSQTHGGQSWSGPDPKGGGGVPPPIQTPKWLYTPRGHTLAGGGPLRQTACYGWLINTDLCGAMPSEDVSAPLHLDCTRAQTPPPIAVLGRAMEAMASVHRRSPFPDGQAHPPHSRPHHFRRPGVLCTAVYFAARQRPVPPLPAPALPEG